MAAVQLIGFVSLSLCACVRQNVRVFCFFNRLPSAPPVGSVHHKGQFLAIFTQAGNKQNICWHFPAVPTMTHTPLLPISCANARIFCFSGFFSFCNRPTSSAHRVFGTRRRNHEERGRKRWLMCKFAVIKFLSRHTQRTVEAHARCITLYACRSSPPAPRHSSN